MRGAQLVGMLIFILDLAIFKDRIFLPRSPSPGWSSFAFCLRWRMFLRSVFVRFPQVKQRAGQSQQLVRQSDVIDINRWETIFPFSPQRIQRLWLQSSIQSIDAALQVVSTVVKMLLAMPAYSSCNASSREITVSSFERMVESSANTVHWWIPSSFAASCPGKRYASIEMDFEAPDFKMIWLKTKSISVYFHSSRDG